VIRRMSVWPGAEERELRRVALRVWSRGQAQRPWMAFRYESALWDFSWNPGLERPFLVVASAPSRSSRGRKRSATDSRRGLGDDTDFVVRDEVGPGRVKSQDDPPGGRDTLSR